MANCELWSRAPRDRIVSIQTLLMINPPTPPTIQKHFLFYVVHPLVQHNLWYSTGIGNHGTFSSIFLVCFNLAPLSFSFLFSPPRRRKKISNIKLISGHKYIPGWEKSQIRLWILVIIIIDDVRALSFLLLTTAIHERYDSGSALRLTEFMEMTPLYLMPVQIQRVVQVLLRL